MFQRIVSIAKKAINSYISCPKTHISHFKSIFVAIEKRVYESTTY